MQFLRETIRSVRRAYYCLPFSLRTWFQLFGTMFAASLIGTAIYHMVIT
jgi:hypothetical protein